MCLSVLLKGFTELKPLMGMNATGRFCSAGYEILSGLLFIFLNDGCLQLSRSLTTHKIRGGEVDVERERGRGGGYTDGGQEVEG